jgi:N-formylglutamate amidohydrolase
MIEPSPEACAFSRLGPSRTISPVVIAVPHAGRAYPAAMLAAARLPRSALETIEDRYADLLVSDAVAAGAVAIVARMARAYVDLNRDPREIDSSILAAPQDAGEMVSSAKVTGGLGVVPSRIAAGGLVWRHPLDAADIAKRLASIHAPYHAAIAAALDAAIAHHGRAVLIDCHSMPPLGTGVRVVIGDRHGTSAAPRFVEAAARAAAEYGITVSRNRPYAGGHTLDRHGSPRTGRQAFQVEIDRTLYLDTAQRDRGPGLFRARAIFAAIAAAVGRVDEIALAAE